MTVIENETAYPYFTTHGDPYVVTDPERGLFTQICKVDTSPSDYGKDRAERIAAAWNTCRGIPTAKLATGMLAALRKQVSDAAYALPVRGTLAERIAIVSAEHGQQILRQDQRIDTAEEALRMSEASNIRLRAALHGMMLEYRWLIDVLGSLADGFLDMYLDDGEYAQEYLAAEALIGELPSSVVDAAIQERKARY